jgi:hypothetical protein
MIVTAASASRAKYCAPPISANAPSLVEQILQRDRVGDLAAFDGAADRGIDPAMDGVAEMLGSEELGDPRMRRVVDEDRPQQRLLGLDIGGRLRHPFEVGLAQRSDCGLHQGHRITPAPASSPAIRCTGV